MSDSDKIIDFDIERKKELISKIRECDSLHNNCDYLLEHNDCDDIVEYIEQLKRENKQLQEKGLDSIVEEYAEALEMPKMTRDRAYKILKHCTVTNCLSNCERLGNCYDCWVSFEDIQAIEFLMTENKCLYQENKKFKNISTEFEKWLENINRLEISVFPRACLDKLQELKEGKK